MIEWSRLFDAIGVPWRDRGKNTSKKDINICCPFCGDDVGFHLGVSLEKEAYFCFRDQTHGGLSTPRLLRALGLSSTETSLMLQQYSDGEALVAASPPEPTDITAKWHKFRPLAESARCIGYLRERGFPDAEDVAKRFDLRFAPDGRWAQRILLPYVENHQVVSWAGRAIRGNLIPKYLMQESSHPGLLYCPRRPHTRIALVEGPIDALKIAAASEHVAPIALSGKAMTDSKLLRLRRLLRDASKVYLILDKDVSVSTRVQMTLQLSQVVPRDKIFNKILPKFYKDPGEMSYQAVRSWLVEE